MASVLLVEAFTTSLQPDLGAEAQTQSPAKPAGCCCARRFSATTAIDKTR
jgi:hypothetical protein